MHVNNEGFSIIELIIVVAVIGLLSTIGAQNYKAYSQKARVQEIASHLVSMKLTVEGVKAEAGYYPGGSITPQVGSENYAASKSDVMLDAILQQIPVAPPDRNKCAIPSRYGFYYIAIDAKSTRYKVLAHCMTNEFYPDGSWVPVTSSYLDQHRSCPTVCADKMAACGSGHWSFGLSIWSDDVAKCAL